MDLESFREYCLKKPGATEGTPFGEDVLVFKVGGKMFALVDTGSGPGSVSLKCDPGYAVALREQLAKRTDWVAVPEPPGVRPSSALRLVDSVANEQV